MRVYQRVNTRLKITFYLLLMMATSPLMAQSNNMVMQDLAMKDDAVCTKCHDKQELLPILSIAQTKHATAADGRTPSCIGCHGASPGHVKEPDEVIPEVNYNKPKWSIAQQNDSCLQCHQGGQLLHWEGGLHDAADVACTSCHEMHVTHDPVMTKKTQSDVCFACHKEKRIQIAKPSRHPVLEGKMGCSDCHNPHGSAGPKLMVRDTVIDTCYQCHMEKRGPYVWNHQPVTEDCAICHNPHGSTVNRLLKTRVPFLCQQCHEPTGHRGRIPVIGTLGTGGGTGGANVNMLRGCLNCHTNIHGGNEATDDNDSRSFRR